VSDSTHALSLLEILPRRAAVAGAGGGRVRRHPGPGHPLNDLIGAVLGRLETAESEATDEAMVVRRHDGSYLVDGGVSTEDLRELLTLSALPAEDDHDYNTVAGMVTARFGRIPHAGEHFEFGGWRFEVVDLDGARIDKLLIQSLADENTSEEV
jgi:putative hemolysin